eukprot:4617072-Pleurochrysis_carterae.AAC.3
MCVAQCSRNILGRARFLSFRLVLSGACSSTQRTFAACRPATLGRRWSTPALARCACYLVRVRSAVALSAIRPYEDDTRGIRAKNGSSR